MTISETSGKDPNFVYGKLHELLELLNNQKFQFFVRNERKIDLSKEFKYAKSKQVQFISILDHYARYKNKHSEFLILPIVFNGEYEILYVGLSLFFKDSFCEEYRSNGYDYIELVIYNLERGHIDTNGVYTKTNHPCLINLEDMKRMNGEKENKEPLSLLGQGSCNCSFSESELFVKGRNFFTGRNNDVCLNEEFIKIQTKKKQESFEGLLKGAAKTTDMIQPTKKREDVISSKEKLENENEKKSKQRDHSIDTNHKVSIINRSNTFYMNVNTNRQSSGSSSIIWYTHSSTELNKNESCVTKEKRIHIQQNYNHNHNYIHHPNDEGKANGTVEKNHQLHHHQEISVWNVQDKTCIHGNTVSTESVEFTKVVEEQHVCVCNHNGNTRNTRNTNKGEKEKEVWKNFNSGFHSCNGNRTYNEDRVVNVENINELIRNECNNVMKNKETQNEYDEIYANYVLPLQNEESPSYMVCAIYDGHNGDIAVNLVQKYLHIHIHSYFIKGNGISQSIKKAFHTMDEQICEHAKHCQEDNHSDYSSGTTACVTILFKNILYIANIGDSRCVLSKNGRAIVLTVDHRVSINKKEKDRIIEAGGTLDDEGYLGGCLGVCRGFGSFDKQTSEKIKGLICEPDLYEFKITEDDEFLIICCDGIFDVMTSQEAVNRVRISLIQNTDAHIAAKNLCDLAYTRKSLDNLSALVVIFQYPEVKKKVGSNENGSLYSSQNGAVRRRFKFTALKNLLNT